MRFDGRKPDQLRPFEIIPNVNRFAEGSALIRMGDTHVLCTASVEPTVPKWLYGTQKGWVTAEYSMLPCSTHERIKRDKALNGGRSLEIGRLIGRAVRAGVDPYKLGERQFIVDCDVLQADGGTRTAAITGGFVALCLAFHNLKKKGLLAEWPVTQLVAGVSAGLHANGPILDLNYVEDSDIQTDMNFVMTENGQFVEIQGTAEHGTFQRNDLLELMTLAEKGAAELFAAQRAVLGGFNVPLQARSPQHP